jgi:hypothetical protein
MKPEIPNERSATDPEAQPIRLADIANDTTIRRHVVQFSGGIGSWAASERVIPLAATVQRMTLLIADTHAEDEDLWRFAEEAALGFGLPLTKVEDGRDPWQVFEHEGFLGNSHVAPCSRHLKQIPARRWLEAHCDPADTMVHVGIDWTETHRIPAIVNGWAPWRVAFPMTEPPYWGKDQMIARAASLDLTPPRLYRKGFAHNNCLTPDTRFITSQGIKALGECIGQSVRVLGKGGGWKDAEIKSFGKQATYTIRLRRYSDEKTITATADHQWPVRKAAGRTDSVFRTTLGLKPGHRIAGMYGQVLHNVTPSAIGIMAGFTFGDGTAPTIAASRGQNQPARAYLCGDKDTALLPYFAGCRTKVEDGKTTVLDLPRAWKSAPDLAESQSYLYGWLAGYFAADGSVSNGSATISSANRTNLEAVRDVAARLGMATGRIRTERRCGYGSEPTDLHGVALVMATLREDFFLIPEHRARFLKTQDVRVRPADWTIVSVDPTNRVEEVMCAVVPDGNVFTLEDNILTHNCGGACVRGGQAAWAHLLEVFPDRFAAAEANEVRFRARHGNVAILKDRRGGVTTPLPLSELRRRIEAAPQQDALFDAYGAYDQDDWGGCGCMSDFADS